jgi:hypothetical protein
MRPFWRFTRPWPNNIRLDVRVTPHLCRGRDWHVEEGPGEAAWQEELPARKPGCRALESAAKAN